MILGGIYQWVTDQAIGYKARPKKHIYIREADYLHGTTFLFINKASFTPDDYIIFQKDYPNALDYDSYVTINGFVEYDDEGIKNCPSAPLEVMKDKHLKELCDIICREQYISPKDAAWITSALAHIV